MNINFKRFYNFVIIAVLSISFTSCFDIKEEVTIHEDGSGSFIQTIDMGDNPMMQMALNMQNDSEDEDGKQSDKAMNKMDSTLEETKAKLANVKGISNIKTASSKEELKYTLMYEFEDVDALNRAMHAAKTEKKGEVKIMQKIYSFKKGEFSRANNFSMSGNNMDLSSIMGGKKGESKEEQTEEEKAQTKKMMELFFGDANYTYIVHVPNKVKSYSNKSHTTVSDDEKTLTMTIPFLELMNDEKKVDVGNNVKFK